jgi:hypothetical protein
MIKVGDVVRVSTFHQDTTEMVVSVGPESIITRGMDGVEYVNHPSRVQER